MKLLAFAVFDVQVGAFMAPFFSHAVGQAVRSFGDAVADPSSPMFKHPADYRLFRVGEFEDRRGMLEGLDGEPELVAKGEDYVAAKVPLREAR